jgi:hypothetical protein
MNVQLDLFGGAAPTPPPEAPRRTQVRAHERLVTPRRLHPVKADGVRTVYDAADRTPEGRLLSLEEKFHRFHDANPDVYAQLYDLAIDWRSRGSEVWSTKGMFEVLRWQRRSLRLDGDQPFKMNNNYTAFYARMLMQEPALEGMFEVRRQTFTD